MAAVEKALPFANITTHQGELDTGAGLITAADSETVSSWEAPLPGTQTGKPIRIAFNLVYLAAILKGMTAETVTWKYSKADTGGLFIDGPSSHTLLMPVRMND